MLDPDLGDLKYEWSQVDFNLSFETKAKVTGVGERSEIRELQRGYRIVKPTESLNDVILPGKTLKRLSGLVELQKRSLSAGLTNQKLTLLLAGVPGSGKSMLARAIANELGSKALVVQLSSKPVESLPVIAALFTARAKRNGYVLIFEECEDLFGRNRFTGQTDGWAKLMFEQFEGIAIFTTNYDLPPAMDRRMSMIVRLKAPNRQAKEIILEREVKRIEITHALQPNYRLAVLKDFARSSGISGGYYKQILEMAASQSSEGLLSEDAMLDAFDYAKESLTPKNW